MDNDLHEAIKNRPLRKVEAVEKKEPVRGVRTECGSDDKGGAGSELAAQLARMRRRCGDSEDCVQDRDVVNESVPNRDVVRDEPVRRDVEVRRGVSNAGISRNPVSNRPNPVQSGASSRFTSQPVSITSQEAFPRPAGPSRMNRKPAWKSPESIQQVESTDQEESPTFQSLLQRFEQRAGGASRRESYPEVSLEEVKEPRRYSQPVIKREERQVEVRVQPRSLRDQPLRDRPEPLRSQPQLQPLRSQPQPQQPQPLRSQPQPQQPQPLRSQPQPQQPQSQSQQPQPQPLRSQPQQQQQAPRVARAPARAPAQSPIQRPSQSNQSHHIQVPSSQPLHS